MYEPFIARPSSFPPEDGKDFNLLQSRIKALSCQNAVGGLISRRS
jgi:hypothetical protein